MVTLLAALRWRLFQGFCQDKISRNLVGSWRWGPGSEEESGGRWRGGVSRITNLLWDQATSHCTGNPGRSFVQVFSRAVDAKITTAVGGSGVGSWGRGGGQALVGLLCSSLLSALSSWKEGLGTGMAAQGGGGVTVPGGF